MGNGILSFHPPNDITWHTCLSNACRVVKLLVMKIAKELMSTITLKSEN